MSPHIEVQRIEIFGGRFDSFTRKKYYE